MSQIATSEQIAVLLNRYQTTKDPKTKAEVKKQLASVGINLTSNRLIKEKEQAAEANAKKDGLLKAAGIVILIMAVPLFFGRDISSWARGEEPRQRIEEVKPEPKQVEAPFNVELSQRVSNLKSELADLEQEVNHLQTQKDKLEKMCEKVSDRMWNLAVISQENWVRQNAGRRDMVYLNKDWLPDRELTGIEKEGQEKMSEKQRAAKQKQQDAALLQNDENVKP